MVENTRVNTFLGNQLDKKDEKATCFYGCGPALVTGTSLGRLQAFDLITSQHIGQSEIDFNHKEMLSDIKGFGNSLLCVDWRGKYDTVSFQIRYTMNL